MSQKVESDLHERQDGVTIRTLGVWGVLSKDDAATALSRQPIRLALLTVVALERQVDRHRLIGMLWPEHAPESARHSLNQNIYLIRQVLGPDILESRGQWVVASDRLHCDVLELRNAVEGGDARRALALYEGRFMPPLVTAPTKEFEKWADVWSSKVSRATRLARLEAIDEYKKSGRYRSALEIAQRWVREDEYQDEAQHALIELLFLNGHPSDAIRQFDTYSDAIRRELDVEPLPETVALAARIREESAPFKPIPAESGATEVGDNSHLLDPKLRRVLAALGVPFVLISIGYGVLAMGPTPSHQLDRVAVLTFEDLSAGRVLGIATRGLTRSVIHHLSEVDQIDVVPYHAVSPIDDGTLVPDSILDFLQVGTVVVGSLQEEQDRLIATVQLISVVNRRYVGSHRIEIPRTDLPSLSDQLAQSVARLLREHLGRELRLESRRVAAPSSESWLAVNRAHDLAEALWSAHGQIPEQLVPEASGVLGRADSLLAHASDIDPDWAEPVALRARVALARAKLEGRGESVVAYEAAIRTALRWADSAVALAPEVAEMTALRGILLHQLGWTLLRDDPDSSDVLIAASDSILRAAIEMDPTNAETWLAFSEVRRREGDVASARFAAKRALEEDAYLRNAERVYQLLFVAELEVGNADEALEWIERGAELFPHDPRFLTGRLTLASWTGQHVLSRDSVFAILRYLDSIDPPTNAGLEREYQRVQRLAMAAGALPALMQRALRQTSLIRSPPRSGM